MRWQRHNAGARVAQALGKGAHVTVFKSFGTAQVKLDDLELELQGPRKDRTAPIRAQTLVEDGTLDDDQKRRDFTINAMAIALNANRFGELIDPFDGVGDTKRKIIRTPQDPAITFLTTPCA